MFAGLFSLAATKPNKNADSASVETELRGNGYGEAYVQSIGADGLDANLVESSYMSGYLAGATPGSSFVTAAAQTSFSDTSALLMIVNNASQTGQPINIRPDTLKLIVSAAGTGVTSMHIAAVLDTSARYGASPGGSALTFQPNSNSGLTQSSVAAAAVGGLGPQVATSSKRIVGRCVLKGSAPVVGDEFLIRFSNAAQPNVAFGSTAASMTRQLEPVLISPGRCLILHAWFPGATAGPNFEPILTQIER